MGDRSVRDRAAGDPSDLGPELSTFAGRYGLAINPETLPAMTRCVQRNRTGRLAGAALGLSFYPVLYAVGVSIPDASVAYGFVGYLLGAFVTAVVSDSPYPIRNGVLLSCLGARATTSPAARLSCRPSPSS